mgnify:CR=1 FL=1
MYGMCPGEGGRGIQWCSCSGAEMHFPGTDTCSTSIGGKLPSHLPIFQFLAVRSKIFRRRQASFPSLTSHRHSHLWLQFFPGIPGCSTSHLWLSSSWRTPSVFSWRTPSSLSSFMADAFSLYLSTACTGNQNIAMRITYRHCARNKIEYELILCSASPVLT